MRFDTEYGYESLALNIVVQAAKDYRKALRDLRKDPDDFDGSGGGGRAASDEHDHEQNELADRRPVHVRRPCVSGSRCEADHLEDRYQVPDPV